MKACTTLLLQLALLLSAALPCFAEQTITVSALGETKVKPDTLVITGEIRESNEKMKDAVTAFNDTRRRAMAAIKELGIENLSIETSALSMKLAGEGMQGLPFGGVPGAEAAAAGSLIISQAVTLTVTGLDQLEEQAMIDLVVKLLSGVKESGVKMGAMDAQGMMLMQMGMGGAAGSSVLFQISNPQAAQKAATRQAMENAKTDAAYLAELAGGKLGPVVAIIDGSPAINPTEQGTNSYAMMLGAIMGSLDDESEGNDKFDTVTVQRTLSVTFKLLTE